MRALLLLCAALIAAPVSADHCFYQPGHLASRQATDGACQTGEMYYPCELVYAEDGVTLLMTWDSDAAGPQPADLCPGAAFPGPRPLSDGELLTIARGECTADARTALDAVVGSELSIVEQIATATNPVTPGYEQRRQWRDWLIGQRDAYVGITLPAITDPAALSPCPDFGYLDFGTWEAQQ